MKSFWIFMMIMNLLVPLTMVGFGAYFKNHAPTEINSVFGYRTKMSMKNKDTWSFAHHSLGREWLYCGIILVPVSVAAMVLAYGKSIDYIGGYSVVVMAFQTVVMLVPVARTEYKMKKIFDENGKRR